MRKVHTEQVRHPPSKQTPLLREYQLTNRQPQLRRRLARIAAELLGADEEEGDRVRLYQSCVFVKPPGFGETNWHSDANMVRRTRRHPRRHRVITFTGTYFPNSTHALTVCAYPP